MSATLCVPLSAMPAVRPTLARWFAAEWPDHYAGRSLGEVEADFPIARGDALPLIVVALRSGQPCGTAALRETSILKFASLKPWLGGLFVHPDHRRSGVARALVSAMEDEARRRGCPMLYAGTVEAHALFDALGWERLAETVQENQAVTVYQRSLLLPLREKVSP